MPVSLTARQRRELERLWFTFGNYGPKTTKGNHSFIQGMLERGQDERPLKQRGYIPTAECELAVERVLRSDDEQPQLTNRGDETGTAIKEQETSTTLRLIHSRSRKPAMIDPELKELMDAVKQRHKAREGGRSNGSDAA